MKDKISNKIRAISKKIAAKYNPQKIILFGSYAYGNPNEDSDIDLCVIKETNKDRFEREQELRLLLFPAGMPIDIIVFTPDEIKKRLALGDFFAEEIIHNGKVLYGGAP